MLFESNNPILDFPTTDLVVDDQFYDIADCPVRAFNPDGTLSAEMLEETVILLRISLKMK